MFNYHFNKHINLPTSEKKRVIQISAKADRCWKFISVFWESVVPMLLKKKYFVINYLTNITNNSKHHQLYLEDFILNNLIY